MPIELGQIGIQWRVPLSQALTLGLYMTHQDTGMSTSAKPPGGVTSWLVMHVSKVSPSGEAMPPGNAICSAQCAIIDDDQNKSHKLMHVH